MKVAEHSELSAALFSEPDKDNQIATIASTGNTDIEAMLNAMMLADPTQSSTDVEIIRDVTSFWGHSTSTTTEVATAEPDSIPNPQLPGAK